MGGSGRKREQVHIKGFTAKEPQMRLIWMAAAAFAFSSALLPADAAPFKAATTIAGAPFNTNGEVTIVHYWATWCAPCRLEMPVLDAYYRKHHAQGLTMLAVSIDQGVSTRKLQDVTGKFAFPVAKIDDVKMPRRDIPAALPVTRVYDRSGRLVFATKGDGRSTIDAATLERVVTPLLAR
jgi:cytochrome c biogenesis protein CcmG/thiol:disulfide interchange protein DsbE